MLQLLPTVFGLSFYPPVLACGLKLLSPLTMTQLFEITHKINHCQSVGKWLNVFVTSSLFESISTDLRPLPCRINRCHAG